MPKSKTVVDQYWNMTESEDTATLSIYGPITSDPWYEDEVSASTFYQKLNSVNGKRLDVRINSGGGEVFEAQAIYNLLKQHTGGVSVYIDGLCCSAATLIACAGDTVVMPSNAVYMIHNPATSVYGSADDMLKTAERLALVKETILNVYVARAGEDKREELKQLMDAETWFSAQEALAYGLVDSISTERVVNSYEDGRMIVNSVDIVADRDKVAKFLIESERDSMDTLSKIKAVLGLDTPSEASVTDAVTETVDNAVAAEEAVKAERERVTMLDALKIGEPMVDALVESAKTEGLEAAQVENMVKALTPFAKEAAENAQRLHTIMDMIKDSAESGVDAVVANPNPVTKDESENKSSDIDALVNMANQLRGGK